MWVLLLPIECLELVFFALLQEFGPFAQATMREWFNQASHPIAGRLYLFWD
jgi:hypothetical protein